MILQEAVNTRLHGFEKIRVLRMDGCTSHNLAVDLFGFGILKVKYDYSLIIKVYSRVIVLSHLQVFHQDI